MVTGRRQSSGRRWLVVAGVALGLHLLLLPFLGLRIEVFKAAMAPPVEQATAAPVEPIAVAPVVLIDGPGPGDPLLPVPGVGDRAAGAAHPLPNAAVDLPGTRAAAAGGEGAGGPAMVGEHRYRESAKQEVWTGQSAYRRPHHGDGHRSESDQWIARQRRRGFDDRTSEPRRRAQAGAEAGSDGVDDSNGARDDGARAEAAPDLRDPLLSPVARRRVPVAADGRVGPAGRRALTSEGEAAVDARHRGPTGDDVRVAAASDETHPLPIDLASPQAGGRDRGVRGARDTLGDAPGRRAGSGNGATRADVPAGPGGVSVWASRGNPYFRRMYERVDGAVQFPRDLALRLEQGHVVVRFELRADGRVVGLRVTRPSSFRAFDRELVRAIGAAGPFGPVPKELLAGRKSIVVVAPYTFRNPLIR